MRDLLAQVPIEAARRVVDVGCGPGNSTELLVERFPAAEIVGLDTSPAMLAEARRRVPRASFAQADAARWMPEAGTDVVFANAIYQWVPDHLDPLTPDEQRAFLDAYQQRIAEAYPAARDGRVLLRFPRLFIVAVR